MHLQSPSVKKCNAKLHGEIGRVNESLNNFDASMHNSCNPIYLQKQLF
jgi:hypothetical protein